MNNIPAPRFRRTRIAAVSLLAAAFLSACVVAPAPRRVAFPQGEVEVESTIPPPVPYTEVIPAPPFAGAVWISGYWGWSGGRHHWVPGRWTQPRPGYRWQPHHWEQGSRGGWHLRGGFWAR